jgi:3-hydroxyacyl-[acyl-carrier-protein] dehydratase
MSNHPELQSLPHGPEFRFVHELSSLEPGASAEGTYIISGNEPFLKGHFPEHPIWPGVVMVEAIAQLGGVVAQSDPEEEKLNDMRLTAIKKAKIIGTAVPGETLKIKARVEGRMGSLIQVSGSVSVGDNCIAKAIVMLSGS